MVTSQQNKSWVECVSGAHAVLRDSFTTVIHLSLRYDLGDLTQVYQKNIAGMCKQ